MTLKRFYNIWYDKMRKLAMKEFMKFISGEKILDIGSGQGIFNEIFRDLGFSKIVALDLGKNLLKLNSAYQKVCSNLENGLPFKDESFDCCFASEIIEHLERRENFLNEIHRVLKGDGYLILTTPNKDSLIAKFDKIIGRFTINNYWYGHNYEHTHVYSFDEIKESIRKKFKIIKLETFYFFYGLPIKTRTHYGMCTWLIGKAMK